MENHIFSICGEYKQYKKQIKLNICSIVINGSSTGQLPIHLKISHEVNIKKKMKEDKVLSYIYL